MQSNILKNTVAKAAKARRPTPTLARGVHGRLREEIQVRNQRTPGMGLQKLSGPNFKYSSRTCFADKPDASARAMIAPLLVPQNKSKTSLARLWKWRSASSNKDAVASPRYPPPSTLRIFICRRTIPESLTWTNILALEERNAPGNIYQNSIRPVGVMQKWRPNPCFIDRVILR